LVVVDFTAGWCVPPPPASLSATFIASLQH
jgi:hypothetical protein